MPGAEALFSAVGLDTLPHGASELNPKQLKFALAFLGCGNATQAARETGFSEENAGKLLKNTGISRFLSLAVKPVAQNGDQLVRRVWERSVSMHAEFMALRGIDRAKRTDEDRKRERELQVALSRNDMLLAALLNRLGIKLTGEVAVTHSAGGGGDFMVVPPDALAGFAAARQEVAAHNRLTGTGGRN